MAKTLAQIAEQLRRKGQRRIERLETAINAEGATKRTQKWARAQIKEIKNAMQGTRYYSKTGKRYKSKTDRYISQQISRLENAVQKVAPRYTVSGDPFEVTQRELNKASAGLPSAYTKEEVKLFYRVTQKIWQREGVQGKTNRNELILDAFNREREKNGLSPLRLDEIVEYILKANKQAKKTLELDPEELTEEQRDLYEEATGLDNADGERPSDVIAGAYQISLIEEALDELFTMPDPTEA